MAKKRAKPSKPVKRGPKEERLVIREDPAAALTRLLNARKSRRNG